MMSSNGIEYDICWDSQQLSNYLISLKVITFNDSNKLLEQEIDGSTFLLMKENDLNFLGFLMGPRKRILHFIEDIKYKLQNESKPLINFPESETKTVNLKSEFGGGDIGMNLIKNELRNTKLSNRSFSCSECGKNYSKNQYVIDHKRTIHCDSHLNYSCRVCGQAFGWRVTLLKHIRKRHPEKKSRDMIDVLYE